MNYIKLANQAKGEPAWNGMEWLLEELEAFAALVAAQEREACARIAELAEPYQTADLIRKGNNMTGYKSKKEMARNKLAQPEQEPWPEEPFGHMAGGVQPAQEPVATLFGTLPVYDNTPPQRPWVDLTDEEIKCIEETTTCSGNESWLRNLTRSLEAKLKEKNA